MLVPPAHSILLAGWLQSPLIFWTAVVGGSAVGLVAVVFLLVRHRQAVVAVMRHPFAKYVVLSVLAHVALVAWLWSSKFFDVTPIRASTAVVVVELEEFGATPESLSPPAAEPFSREQTPAERFSPANDPPLLTREPPPETAEPAEIPAEDPHAMQPARDHRVDSPLADLDRIEADPPAEATPFADAERPERVGSEAFPEFESAPDFSTPEDFSNLDNEIQEPADTDESSLDSRFDDPTATSFEPLVQQDTRLQERTPEAPATQTSQVVSSEPIAPPLAEPPTEMQSASLPTRPSAPAVLQPQLQPISSTAQQRLVASAGATRSAITPETKTVPRRADGRRLPAIYRDRWVQDRLAVARMRGGSEATEKAVERALVWLSQAQSNDGRWDASHFGSGRPVREGGQDRGTTGLNADTATTGLALLAFLGAGHTHLTGHNTAGDQATVADEYADVLRRGIDFLLRAQGQRADGSLVGAATGYAAMYCHGIATLALSEAYSLTGDPSLPTPLSRAVQFTLDAQHAQGGWRYRPQEPGDTSQLGWQLMALTSAHYGGYAKRIADHPNRTWSSASRFLDRVAWGSNGGLAAYKPDQRPSRTMTAEALLCRLLLNTPTDHPRILEAADYVSAELPGQGRRNYYYWYYGTLGLYHLQDEHWRRWNQALTSELVRLQRTDGSWPVAQSVWGNAGGAVYTTALGAMTLEVYYRYRPFAETHRVDRTARRP